MIRSEFGQRVIRNWPIRLLFRAVQALLYVRCGVFGVLRAQLVSRSVGLLPRSIPGPYASDDAKRSRAARLLSFQFCSTPPRAPVSAVSSEGDRGGPGQASPCIAGSRPQHGRHPFPMHRGLIQLRRLLTPFCSSAARQLTTAFQGVWRANGPPSGSLVTPIELMPLR